MSKKNDGTLTIADIENAIKAAHSNFGSPDKLFVSAGMMSYFISPWQKTETGKGLRRALEKNILTNKDFGVMYDALEVLHKMGFEKTLVE